MKNRSLFTLAGAAAGIVGLGPIASLADGDKDRFGPWGAPERLGAPNTEFAELCPSVSGDGRSLYFFSNRPGGSGGNDIWVSQRRHEGAEWGPAQNLAVLNSPFEDNAPWLSRNGHALYFTSGRPGGHGGLDLYVSYRLRKQDDLGWLPPVNLGSAVNSAANDVSPATFVDERTGERTLLFASNRPGGLGGDDIYSSTRQRDGSFSVPTLVTELSSPFADRLPGVRPEGREIYITSDRPGTVGGLDLWVATRNRASHGQWSTPVNLGAEINTIEVDGCARLADGGTKLYFHSTSFGGAPLFDLFVSEREKARDKHD